MIQNRVTVVVYQQKIIFFVTMVEIAGDNQVKVGIKAVGICGSDVHYWKVRKFNSGFSILYCLWFV